MHRQRGTNGGGRKKKRRDTRDDRRKEGRGKGRNDEGKEKVSYDSYKVFRGAPRYHWFDIILELL